MDRRTDGTDFIPSTAYAGGNNLFQLTFFFLSSFLFFDKRHSKSSGFDITSVTESHQTVGGALIRGGTLIIYWPITVLNNLFQLTLSFFFSNMKTRGAFFPQQKESQGFFIIIFSSDTSKQPLSGSIDQRIYWVSPYHSHDQMDYGVLFASKSWFQPRTK